MIYPDWPAPGNVKAVSTTRQGGVSGAPFTSLNLADHVGDDAAAVQENRTRLGQAVKLTNEPVWLAQAHGDCVVDAATVHHPVVADASYTDRSKVICAVLTADCLPVLLCNRNGTRVAAAHAGWRGLASGVLENTVQALDTQPQQLMAWLGPAIGPDVFEVGDEVRSAFVGQHPHAKHAFVARTDGRWLANLYQLARVRLAAVGVTAVYGGSFCTYTEPDRFYSYRRDHQTGRMASLVWLS